MAVFTGSSSAGAEDVGASDRQHPQGRGFAPAGALRPPMGAPPVPEQIAAHVLALISDLATQMIDAAEDARGGGLRGDKLDAMTSGLLSCEPLVTHCFGLTVEYLGSVRLSEAGHVDALMPPLICTALGTEERDVARLAAQFVQAQAEFLGNMRRMRLPFPQLPEPLLALLMNTVRDVAGCDGTADAVERHCRARHDGNSTRLALLDRLEPVCGTASAKQRLELAGAPCFVAHLAALRRIPHAEAAPLLMEEHADDLLAAMQAAGAADETQIRTMLLLHGRWPLALRAA
ncbi:hypothetical protein EYB45_07315 [Erythrobacteraceae bacterium CFH 75059]|uniref:hypothetical protein n=1 Tax=Qipengyuania thermophila TaxID=2509361 RepID=UPI00102098CD|nr:hypothetical protein [Qipengyuania thermophila]TCD05282.1 hypothetical protein EYB45_07315 [Erythrobacteraceae bacterium CFH 75059]